MSVKKSLKAGLKAAYNPIGAIKDSIAIVKRDITSKPKIDTSAQDNLLEQQRVEQASLDDEENRRRKKLLAAAQGVRAYRGSPMFRQAPGNAAGVGTSAAGASSVVGGRGTYAGNIGSGAGGRGTYPY